MPRTAITVSKTGVSGASTNYRKALDATNDMVFTPTDINKCMLIVTNTTAGEKAATIRAQDGGSDIVLTLAAGNVTPQLEVVAFSALDDSAEYVKGDGTVEIDIAADMTGFAQVVELKPAITIGNAKGTGTSAALVDIATLDGAKGVVTPDALGFALIGIRNTLTATNTPTNQNDKKVWIKAGNTGIASGVGDYIVNCKENAFTNISGLDSSRFQNADGTIEIRVQEGITGSIQVGEV
jgi:hypothetical protein